MDTWQEQLIAINNKIANVKSELDKLLEEKENLFKIPLTEEEVYQYVLELAKLHGVPPIFSGSKEGIRYIRMSIQLKTCRSITDETWEKIIERMTTK